MRTQVCPVTCLNFDVCTRTLAPGSGCRVTDDSVVLPSVSAERLQLQCTVIFRLPVFHACMESCIKQVHYAEAAIPEGYASFYPQVATDEYCIPVRNSLQMRVHMLSCFVSTHTPSA
jgi:hypothetical protein